MRDLTFSLRGAQEVIVAGLELLATVESDPTRSELDDAACRMRHAVEEWREEAEPAGFTVDLEAVRECDGYPALAAPCRCGDPGDCSELEHA